MAAKLKIEKRGDEILILNFNFKMSSNFNCSYMARLRALDIDVFLYPTLTIQASSRLKHSTNHLWNNSYVCRKKFGE
jgi:hypothetical protein